MATVEIPILGAHTVPDQSGNVYLIPLSFFATNDLYDTMAFAFGDSGTKIELNGSFVVPQNYAGTAASIVVLWTAAATAGDVVWDFDYNAIGGDDAESLDPSSHTDSDTATDDAPSVSLERQVATITLTAGDFAAGDLVLFQFGRDGTSGSDTLAATALVVGLLFQYDT